MAFRLNHGFISAPYGSFFWLAGPGPQDLGEGLQEPQYVRKLGRKTPQSYEDYREFVETRPPEVVANLAIYLIHQTNYLVDQQLHRLERDFLEQGGPA